MLAHPVLDFLLQGGGGGVRFKRSEDLEDRVPVADIKAHYLLTAPRAAGGRELIWRGSAAAFHAAGFRVRTIN